MRYLRRFLTGLLLAPLAALPAAPGLNIVLITADDMNWDSTGCYGGLIKDLTPNLDRLAADGMRFQHAYSTVAVCQPAAEAGGLIRLCLAQAKALHCMQESSFMRELHLNTMHWDFSPVPHPPHIRDTNCSH